MTFPVRWTGPKFKHQLATKAEVREVTKRTVQRMDKKEKDRVRERDKETCRVCGRSTRHVHERLFKSLGGIACLLNSMVACPNRCHGLLQGHAIRPLGPNCNEPLIFQMTEKTAYLIFRGRPTPGHVEIVAKVEPDDEARSAMAEGSR
jgi:hypothetical protein